MSKNEKRNNKKATTNLGAYFDRFMEKQIEIIETRIRSDEKLIVLLERIKEEGLLKYIRYRKFVEEQNVRNDYKCEEEDLIFVAAIMTIYHESSPKFQK